jgi:hypothetical protein
MLLVMRTAGASHSRGRSLEPSCHLKVRKRGAESGLQLLQTESLLHLDLEVIVLPSMTMLPVGASRPGYALCAGRPRSFDAILIPSRNLFAPCPDIPVFPLALCPPSQRLISLLA